IEESAPKPERENEPLEITDIRFPCDCPRAGSGLELRAGKGNKLLSRFLDEHAAGGRERHTGIDRSVIHKTADRWINRNGAAGIIEDEVFGVSLRNDNAAGSRTDIRKVRNQWGCGRLPGTRRRNIGEKIESNPRCRSGWNTASH